MFQKRIESFLRFLRYYGRVEYDKIVVPEAYVVDYLLEHRLATVVVKPVKVRVDGWVHEMDVEFLVLTQQGKMAA